MRVMWIQMFFVEKFDDMEPAAVHIEMDIPLFKIRRICLPYCHLRIVRLHGAPCRIPNPLAMDIWSNKEEFKIAPCAIHPYYKAACFPAVMHDSKRKSAVDGALYGLAGDDFPLFLEMVIPQAKFLQRSISERFLIVQNKLFPILLLQGTQHHICHDPLSRHHESIALQNQFRRAKPPRHACFDSVLLRRPRLARQRQSAFFRGNQYSLAPAGMWSSTIKRCSRSSPASVWSALISMPQDSMPIIALGGRLVMAIHVLPTSSSGS